MGYRGYRSSKLFFVLFLLSLCTQASATRTHTSVWHGDLVSPTVPRPRIPGSCEFPCPDCMRACFGCDNGCCASQVCVTRAAMTQNEANNLCGQLGGSLAPTALVQSMLGTIGANQPVWTSGVVTKVVEKHRPVLAFFFGTPPKVKIFKKGKVVHPDGTVGRHKPDSAHPAVCLISE